MSKYLDPGIHPFWFWNAPLTEEIIAQQLEQMAAAGVRGVFIHPRQGMQVPYLSTRFFELIKMAIQHCVRLGLQPHLYDEFPYPAGIAGGLVTMGRPEFQATRLQQWQQETSGGRISYALPVGAVLNCLAIPIIDGQNQWDASIDLKSKVGVAYSNESHFKGGLSNYTEQRYFAHDPVPVLECDLAVGDYLICASVQSHVDNHKYWNHYVDVCNPEAMQSFMHYTQDRYVEALGADMQHVVAWFVDEIHPDWSRLLPQHYHELYGEEMDAAYVALNCEEHPRHQEMQERLRRLKFESFSTSFERPVSTWCREHDLLYVVEKPQLYIEQLSFADVPGCDTGHRRAGVQHDLLRAGLRYNARATGSAAQVYDKQAALCEGFHSLGWSATLEDVRLLCDNLILHGIDRITPHAFFASTHGLRKHDAPPSFFQQQAYWPLFKYVSQRIAGMHKQLGQLRHAADAVLIDPSAYLSAVESEAYETFLHQLTASPCEYLIVDASFITAQDLSRGFVDVAGRPVSKIIQFVDSTGLDVDAFIRGGGEVFHAEIPEVTHASITALGDEHMADQVHQARFVTDTGIAVFVINNNPQAVTIAQANLGDRQLRPLSIDPEYDETWSFDLDGRAQLAAFASVLFEEVTEVHCAAEEPAVIAASLSQANGEWGITRDRSNLLRLEQWELRVFQDDACRGAGLCFPQPIAEQIHQAQIPLSYARRQRFGQQAQLSLPAVRAHYQRLFQVSGVLCDVSFVFEDTAFRGQDWVLRVNDQAFTQEHVSASMRFGLGTQAIDISAALQQGENTLCLELACAREDDGLLAVCFLSGAFDCMSTVFGIEEVSAARFVVHAAELDFNDLNSYGCHYFDGVLTFTGSIDLALSSSQSPAQSPALSPTAAHVDIDCERLVGESFEIQINGGVWYPVLWSPRRVRIPVTSLKDGENTCVIKRYGNLGRCYDGEIFDYSAHQRLCVDESHRLSGSL